jgi:hypothetical protein
MKVFLMYIAFKWDGTHFKGQLILKNIQYKNELII